MGRHHRRAEISIDTIRLGCIMPTIAGMMLAGCTASVPVQQPYTATMNAPDGWPYWNGGYYAPPARAARILRAEPTAAPLAVAAELAILDDRAEC